MTRTVHHCDMCEYHTVKKRDLENHKLSKHVNVRCCDYPNCNFETTTQGKLESHIKTNHMIVYLCDQPNCTYQTKSEYSLNKHKARTHRIDRPVVYYCDECDFKTKERKSVLEKHKLTRHINAYRCAQPNCNFKTNCVEGSKMKSLIEHNARVHNIHEWKCDQLDCAKIFKSKDSLEIHKSVVHDIGDKCVFCDEPNCDESFFKVGFLTLHKRAVHDIGVTWHYCDQPNCGNKFKTEHRLKKHKAFVHDIDVTWHYCDHCDEKFKNAWNLKTHKASLHDIDVTWHYCDQPNCDFKAKSKSSVKTHKSYIHDIDVKWHHCDQANCNSKFKFNSDLTSHKEQYHDIGKHLCEYCYSNRNSTNEYIDQRKTKSNICNGCYAKITGKNTRKEKVWSDYIDGELGTLGLLASDRSLKSQGGCQLYRPDKLYTDVDYVEVGECDEHQHAHSNYSYECDERRISEIYEEDGICGKYMSVLRYNPDTYKPKDGYTKLGNKKRLELYVALAKKLRNMSHKDPIHIYYICYSEDNRLISKNIPHTMIYSMDDILRLSIEN